MSHLIGYRIEGDCAVFTSKLQRHRGFLIGLNGRIDMGYSSEFRLNAEGLEARIRSAEAGGVAVDVERTALADLQSLAGS